ncbi:MAG: peptide-methionine (S)-S-oxide reductase MsrA [Muribaculaceae bacterium]|nr:peptide-methionine (S)-S-oxide reductase MsrA [Muribaculaceae bacterium]
MDWLCGSERHQGQLLQCDGAAHPAIVFVAENILIMTHNIYLAGGCFWGLEHFFKQMQGVVDTEVGYANGNVENPTYQDVCTDETGFAETVRVCYDPTVIGLDTLLTMYFLAIDPLSVNKQGEDEGTQYRTGIYYCDSTDLPLIEQKMDEVAERYNGPLAVEVQPLRNFYPAEDYHQDYLEKNPTGYCHVPVALFEMARRFRSGE